MKKLVVLAFTAFALGTTTTEASASGCASPFCQGGGGHWGKLFHKYPMPAFQAAPWYLYWPYNAHFMTPAPLTGPYYAPPYSGGQLVNPYFPAHPALPGVPVPPAPMPGSVNPSFAPAR